MTRLQCGCSDDARYHCLTHKSWLCHNESDPFEHAIYDGPPCPPCRIAKWRSVSLSSAATPTRNGR